MEEMASNVYNEEVKCLQDGSKMGKIMSERREVIRMPD